MLDEPLVEYRTYPVKSADATAESLNPTATRRRWLMTRPVAQPVAAGRAAPASTDAVTRTARRELVRCLWHRHWLKHIAWDFYLVAAATSSGQAASALVGLRCGDSPLAVRDRGERRTT